MSGSSIYKFKDGKMFSTKEAGNKEEYLGTAEQLHEYLEECKIATPDGIYWKDPDFTFNNDLDIEDLSIYSGSCGITYLYLQLYKITKKQIYMDLVLASADYLDTHWQKQIEVAPEFLGSLVPSKLVGCGITIGIAGIGMVLEKVYRQFGRSKDKEAIEAITDYIVEHAIHENGQTYWTGKPSAIFDGGIVLYLYKITDFLKNEKILDTAIQATDTLLSKATKDERGGWRWSSFVETIHLPNYDGTAGTSYVLSVAYQYTKNRKYLEAAIEGVRMIRTLAVKKGEGYIVPFQDIPGEEPIYYMSSCNGPAGTSRVFYNLYQITGNDEYLEDIRKLFKGMRYMEVPEKQSKGYWNTTCLCCGTAGVLQYAINYHRVFRDEESRRVAIMSGNILLAENEKQKKGIAWPMAFERLNPQKITKSIAYETGSSGNAGALLQLYLFLSGRDNEWDQLYDDPFL